MKNALFIILLAIFTPACNVANSGISPEATSISQNVPTIEIKVNEDTGFVTGTLEFLEANDSKPVSNISLFLAEVLKDESGIPRVVSVNRADSPRAATDIKGQFVFSNIPPGEYGIVLDIVVKAYLLPEPGSDSDLLIQVEPGEIIDLGLLQYDADLLPGFSIEP
jgi:hypothetical protein